MIPRHLVIAVAVMFAVAIGMSVYVWRARRMAPTEPAAYSHPVAPPVEAPTEEVTLYVAHDDIGALRAQSARIPLPSGRQERAEELLRALLRLYLVPSSLHAMPAAAELHDVYLVDPGLAVIDVNAALADGHRSGILVEELTIASLERTLSANVPGISRIKILVDGKSRDTLAGHADLSGFYDVSAVDQVAAELQ
jgi:sporulation and spore germination protein